MALDDFLIKIGTKVDMPTTKDINDQIRKIERLLKIGAKIDMPSNKEIDAQIRKLEKSISKLKISSKLDTSSISNLENQLKNLKATVNTASFSQSALTGLRTQVENALQGIQLGNINIGNVGQVGQQAGQQVGQQFNQGLQNALNPNIIDNFKESLRNIRMDDTKISDLISRIQGLNIQVDSLSQKTKSDGFMTINVTGIDKFGQAVSFIQKFDTATNTLIGDMERVSTTAKNTANQLDASMSKLIQKRSELQNILEKSYQSAIDPNASRTIKDGKNLDDLETRYNNITTAIHNMSNTSKTAFAQEEASIRQMLTELDLAIKKYQNMENVRTSFKPNKIDDALSVIRSDLKGLEADISKAGVSSKVLTQEINKVKSALAKRDNGGILNKDEVEQLRTNIVNAKRELEALQKVERANAESVKKTAKVQENYYSKIISNLKEIARLKKANNEAGVQEEKLNKAQIKRLEEQNRYRNKQLDKKGIRTNEWERSVNDTKVDIKRGEELDYAKRIDTITYKADTGDYESKVNSAIAKARQWTNVAGESRISTARLEEAFRKLDDANDAYAKDKDDVAKQKALIDVTNKLEQELKSVANATRQMNAEFAKDTSITNLRSRIQEFYDKNRASHKKYGTQLKRMMKDLESESGVTRKELAKINAELKGIANNCRSAGLLGDTLFGSLIDQAKKFSQWFSVTTIVMRGIMEVRQAISTVTELDNSLVDLAKTANMSTSQLNEFYYTANDVAKQMGTSTNEIIQQASAWSRLGYSTSEAATEMAKYSAMFKTISPGMTLDSATDGLVSVVKAFKIGEEDVSEVVDGIMSKINIIGNTKALSNSDIVDFLTRSSSAMAEANNSLEETIALGTAATEITRDAASVGNMLKTVSMRIRGYDEETESYSEELANLSGEIADLTKTASSPGGISIFTDETKTTYKSTFQILSDIEKIYDELTDKQQASLLEALAGKRQGQAVASIINNFDAARESLESMANSAGSAEREMSIAIDTISYKANTTKEIGTSIAQNLFGREDLKIALDGINTIGNGLDFLTDKLGLFKTIAITGGLFAFVKNFEHLKSVGDVSNALSVLNKNATATTSELATAMGAYSVETLKATLSQSNLTKEQIEAIIAQKGLSAEQQKAIVTEIEQTMTTNSLAKSEATATATTTTFSTSLKGLAVSFKALAVAHPILTAIAGITTAVFVAKNIYDKYNVTLEEHLENLEGLSTEYEQAKTDIENINSELENTQKELDELLAKEHPTFTDEAEIERLKETTRELQLQKELKEDLAKEKGEDLAKEAVDTYEDNYSGTKSFDKTIVDDTIKLGKESVNNYGDAAIADDSSINNMIASYKIYADEIEKYDLKIHNLKKQLNSDISESRKEEIQSELDNSQLMLDTFSKYQSDIQSKINKEKQALLEALEDLKPQYQDISSKKSSGMALTTGEMKSLEAYESMKNTLKGIYEYTDKASWNITEFDSIFKTDNLEKTKDELVSLAKEGKLTEDSIKNLPKLYEAIGNSNIIPDGNESKLQAFIGQIIALGDTAENSSDSMNELGNSISSTETLGDSISDFQKKIDKLSDALALVRNGEPLPADFLAEFDEIANETGDLEHAIKSLIYNSLQELYDSIGQPLPDSIVKALERETNEAVVSVEDLSDSFSDLENKAKIIEQAKEEISSSGKISASSLNEIVSLYPQALAYVGEYANGTMTHAQLLEKLQSLYDTDKNNYVSLLKTKLETDENFYNTHFKNNEKFLKEMNKLYGSDYKNYGTVAQKKLEIENKLIETVAKNWGAYYKVRYNAESGLYDLEDKSHGLGALGGGSLPINQKKKAQATKEAVDFVNKMNEAIKLLNAPLDLVSNLNLSTSGLGSNSSGKSKDKSEKDTLLEKFKNWMSGLFDWIEIKLERQADKISNYTQKAEKATEKGNYSSASSNYMKAIDATSSQIKNQESAYAKYNKQADSVLQKAVDLGLVSKKTASSIKKNVQNGTLDIKKYNERTQEVISSYATWHDKAKDSKNSINELHESIRTYIKDLKDLRDAQRDAKLEKIDTATDFVNNTSNTDSPTSFAFQNSQLNKQQKAYANATNQAVSDRNSLGKKATTSISNALKTKKGKNSKTYKKALSNAQKAVKGKKKVSSSDLNTIKKYSSNVYSKILAYNESFDNIETAKMEEALNYASVSSQKYENRQARYDAIEQGYDDDISLLGQQADNATSADEANKYIKQQITKENQKIINDNNAIKSYTTSRDNAAKKINVKDSTLRGNKYKSLKTKNRKTVDNFINAIQKSVKSGKAITENQLATLLDYYEKGYITEAFYNACVDYNNAVERLDSAKAKKETDIETQKKNNASYALEMYNNKSEEYQNDLSANDTARKALDTAHTLKTTKGFNLTEKDYDNLIANTNARKKIAENAKKDLQATIDANLKSGYWKEGSEELQTARDDLQSYDDTINQCTQDVAEFNNNKLNVKVEGIDIAIAQIESVISALESEHDYKIAIGVDLKDADFDAIGSQIDELIKKNDEKYADYYSKYLKSIAEGGAYGEKTTEEWLTELNNLRANGNSLKVQKEENRKAKRDNKWLESDRYVDKLEMVSDKLSWMRGLIDDDMMYDKDGNLTELGNYAMATDLKLYDTKQEEIDEDMRRLAELEEMYANNEYTYDEYMEKRKEYESELQSDVSDSIEVQKKFIDYAKKSADVELERLNKIIDARKKALQAKKDYYDYDKQLRNQNKDILSLQSQISALEGIDTAEAKAEKARLQAELAEKEEERSETIKEHNYDLQSKALDDFSETLAERYDEYVDNITTNFKDINTCVENARDVFGKSFSELGKNLASMLKDLGIDPTTVGFNEAGEFPDISKSGFADGGIVRQIKQNGDSLLASINPNETVLTQKFTDMLPRTVDVMRTFNNGYPTPTSTMSGGNNVVVDSIIRVDGNVDKSVFADVEALANKLSNNKKLLKASMDYTTSELVKDAKKLGIQRRF